MEIKSALITGANKGIGFETARQLLKKGYYIYLGSRTWEQGSKALEELNTQGFNNVEIVQIDVSEPESVKRARIAVGKKQTYWMYLLIMPE